MGLFRSYPPRPQVQRPLSPALFPVAPAFPDALAKGSISDSLQAVLAYRAPICRASGTDRRIAAFLYQAPASFLPAAKSPTPRVSQPWPYSRAAQFADQPILFAGQAALSWTASGDGSVTGYYIGWDTVSHSGQVSTVYANVIDVGNVTSYTVGGLTPGVTYYFGICSHGAGGHDEFESLSVETSFTVPLGPSSETSSGALTAQSAAITGTATRTAQTRTSSGALSAQSASLAGTATRAGTGKTSSGALSAQASSVAGTATRTVGVNKSSSGAITAQSSTVYGAALVIAPAVVVSGKKGGDDARRALRRKRKAARALDAFINAEYDRITGGGAAEPEAEPTSTSVAPAPQLSRPAPPLDLARAMLQHRANAVRSMADAQERDDEERLLAILARGN